VMLSQNESILRNPKAMLVGVIIERHKINVGGIIVEVILIQASQEQTSIPFPMLITEICETTRIPFRRKTEVRITRISYSDIQRINTGQIFER